MCWLYQKTGDKYLLNKSIEEYEKFCSLESPFTLEALMSDEVPRTHSVSNSENLKIPAILYICTGDKKYLDGVINGVKKLYKYHGIVDGLPSGNEYHDGNFSNEVHETCTSSDMQWALGYLLKATGDPKWADLIEKICFNVGMGSVTWITYGSDGIAATLYSPSILSTTIPGSTEKIKIIETTNYPFEGSIKFEIKMNTTKRFNFLLRIPSWAKQYTVSLNGKKNNSKVNSGEFFKLNNKFSDGDIVELNLQMNPVKFKLPRNGIAFSRGPLVFSLPIAEKSKIHDSKVDEGIIFRSTFKEPDSKWNYAPLSNTKISVNKSNDFSNPWEIKSTPIKLEIEAYEVKNWQLYKDMYTPQLPSTINKGDKQNLVLVPLGATTLRATIFPDKTRIEN